MRTNNPSHSLHFLRLLQNLGLKIGILDADVYGPSLPKLINLNEKPKSEDGKAMIPVEKYNAQCMSCLLYTSDAADE